MSDRRQRQKEQRAAKREAEKKREARSELGRRLGTAGVFGLIVVAFLAFTGVFGGETTGLPAAYEGLREQPTACNAEQPPPSRSSDSRHQNSSLTSLPPARYWQLWLHPVAKWLSSSIQLGTWRPPTHSCFWPVRVFTTVRFSTVSSTTSWRKVATRMPTAPGDPVCDRRRAPGWGICLRGRGRGDGQPRVSEHRITVLHSHRRGRPVPNQQLQCLRNSRLRQGNNGQDCCRAHGRSGRLFGAEPPIGNGIHRNYHDRRFRFLTAPAAMIEATTNHAC